MSALIQHRNRTNLSYLGLSEGWIAEEPEYTKVYEFEKQDFFPIFQWLQENTILACSLSLVYVGFIWALQRLMRTRQAYELRRPLFFWSASMAVLSITMFSRFLPEIIHINKKYGFYRSYCKLDHTNAASLFWLIVYIFSKMLEFEDTVFIVLRKQRLTFLHVFHHASVHIASILGFIRVDGAARYFVVMNTFVHSLMYTYYALKAAKFNIPKKVSMAITTVQLLQFAAAAFINILVFHAKVSEAEPLCERHGDISLFFLLLSLIYFGLFGKFFVQAYTTKHVNKSKPQ